jgi:hypothetical protein
LPSFIRCPYPKQFNAKAGKHYGYRLKIIRLIRCFRVLSCSREQEANQGR